MEEGVVGVGIPHHDLSLPTFPPSSPDPSHNISFVLLTLYPLILQMTLFHLVCVGFASNIRLVVPPG